MALHPQAEGFDAGEDEESVEGRQASSQIPQEQSPQAGAESGVSEILGKDDAVIADVRLVILREAGIALKLEGTAVHRQTRQGIAMAARNLVAEWM